MKTAAIALTLSLGAPLAATAQDIFPCDARAELWTIPEPWDENTRSFANGEVRLVLIDTIEPAAIPYYLGILHPPRDTLGGRRCTMIGFGEGIGYQVLYFKGLQAGYDPARGVLFSIPGRLYDPNTDFSNGLVLDVVVNQATGAVTASHRLGNK